MKECIFSETRRKRKSGLVDSEDPVPHVKRRMTSPEDDRAVATSGSTTSTPQPGNSNWPWPASPNAQRGDTIQSANQMNHSGQFKPVNGSSYQYEGVRGEGPRGDNHRHGLLNESIAGLLHPNVATNHEALHLLSVAAGQSEQANRQALQNQNGPLKLQSTNLNAPRSHLPQQHNGASNTMSSMMATARVSSEPNVELGPHDQALQSALHAWSRMKFVRAGWITSHEAVAYID